MNLAGTFLRYIIRGDHINKPALVRRKHGDATSFLGIILLHSPQNLCMTLALWRLEAAWLCLSVRTALLRVCSRIQSDEYAKSLWGIIWKEIEFCLPETCRHLEMFCRASRATAQSSFNSCNQQTTAECDKARVSAENGLGNREGRETVDRYQVGGADVKALTFSQSVERVETRLVVLHSVMV